MPRSIKASLLLSLSVAGVIVAAPVWSVSDGDNRQSLDILIEQLSGTVDVSTDGAASRAEIGDALALPSRIVTGDDGNILLRQGRTGVDIAADSDVEIPEAAADGQLIARMIQHRGSAFYDVETRPLEQLKLTIETPYLVAVVKGTQFNVAVVDGATTISLFEGTLEIRTPDGLQSIQLNAGEIAIRSLLDDTIRRLPMNGDLADIGRADGRDTAGTASGTPARTAPAATASASVAAVENGIASAPTGDAVEGGTVTVASAVRASATEVTRVAVNVDTVSTVAVRVDTRIDASVGLAVDVVDVGIDVGLDKAIDLDGGAVDVGVDTQLDTGVDLGGGIVDLGLDTGIIDAGVSLDSGNLDIGLDTSLDTEIDLGRNVLDATRDLGLISPGTTTGGAAPSGSTSQTGGGLLGGLLSPLL